MFGHILHEEEKRLANLTASARRRSITFPQDEEMVPTYFSVHQRKSLALGRVQEDYGYGYIGYSYSYSLLSCRPARVS
jgi:hypothetical protein